MDERKLPRADVAIHWGRVIAIRRGGWLRDPCREFPEGLYRAVLIFDSGAEVEVAIEEQDAIVTWRCAVPVEATKTIRPLRPGLV